MTRRRRALVTAAGIVATVTVGECLLARWNPTWAVLAATGLAYVLLLGPLDEDDPAYPLVQRWRALRSVFRRRRRRRQSD